MAAKSGPKDDTSAAPANAAQDARDGEGLSHLRGPDGQRLPRLPKEEYEKVLKACYFAQHDQCKRTAKECYDLTGRSHEKLPPRLQPYIRIPGSKGRGRDQSQVRDSKTTADTGAPAGGTPEPKVRYDTVYCYEWADKKTCKNGDVCSFDHMTNEAAKEAAGGKV